jgi:4'-phosphopantetheinyl transferase
METSPTSMFPVHPSRKGDMSDTVYWTLVDSSHASLEAPEGFLSSSELQKFRTFRFAKRRQEWLLGRWAAKFLIKSLPAYQGYAPPEIEILTSPDGAPYIQLPDKEADPNILSISHCDRYALCAIASGTDIHIGIDMEKIEARSQTFIKDYFTPLEVGLVNSQPYESQAMISTLIWSTKESMLKALRVGLRWDTRQVEIREVSGKLEKSAGWNELQLTDLQQEKRGWFGWCQKYDGYVITVAGFPEDGPGIKSIQLVEMQGNRSE